MSHKVQHVLARFGLLRNGIFDLFVQKLSKRNVESVVVTCANFIEISWYIFILYEFKMQPSVWSLVLGFYTVLCYHAGCDVCVYLNNCPYMYESLHGIIWLSVNTVTIESCCMVGILFFLCTDVYGRLVMKVCCNMPVFGTFCIHLSTVPEFKKCFLLGSSVLNLLHWCLKCLKYSVS